LYVSRWSIRRKLLLCLAIVLSIVAALAYSGFAGAYSYKELAWTIGVRATDLKLASELRESLGDLRVSLSRTQELSLLFETPSVTRRDFRDEFLSKLNDVQQDLAKYRQQVDGPNRPDPRFGDPSQERQTVVELEKTLNRVRRNMSDPKWVFEDWKPALVSEEVDAMYVQASGLQSKMHNRMRGFANEVKSEYRT
jgi:two-component system, NtrC family, sensor kinase